MRRELFRSRPFRMAGLYAGVFAVLSAVSLALMLGLYRHEASREVAVAMDREAAALTQAWQDGEIDGVRAYLQVLRMQPLGERWSVVLQTPTQTLEIPQRPEMAVTAKRARITRELQLAPNVTAQLHLSTQFERESLRLLSRALVTGVVALIVLALVGGILLAWLTNRRVSRMDRALAAIMQGDLSSRLPVRPKGDELDRLAANVNLALDRVQLLMESVRSATDGIAHDLRTPLARHRARLEQAQRQPPAADEFDTWIEAALADVDGVLATFRGLLQVATVEAGTLRNDFATVDLCAVAASIAELYEPLVHERQLQLKLELPSAATVHGSRNLLAQCVANLLDNAIKFSPVAGMVTLRLRRSSAGIELSVTDQGPGIPPSEREQVFQRLYRMDRSRSTPGLGLGLSLAKAVTELHGGSIRIEDHQPGTRVVMRLPSGPATALPVGA